MLPSQLSMPTLGRLAASLFTRHTSECTDVNHRFHTCKWVSKLRCRPDWIICLLWEFCLIAVISQAWGLLWNMDSPKSIGGQVLARWVALLIFCFLTSRQRKTNPEQVRWALSKSVYLNRSNLQQCSLGVTCAFAVVWKIYMLVRMCCKNAALSAAIARLAIAECYIHPLHPTAL